MRSPLAPVMGIGAESFDGRLRSERSSVVEKDAPESGIHHQVAWLAEPGDRVVVVVSEKFSDIMYLLS